MSGDPNNFSLDDYALTDQQMKETPAAVPKKIRKRRGQFIMVPMAWREALEGATGQTVLLALDLLYLGWRRWKKTEPVTLPNGMLRHNGISRYAKWRGLNELERRGLITVERRPGRPPHHPAVATCASLRQAQIASLRHGCCNFAADGLVIIMFLFFLVLKYK
jgi:hypothetical protein